MILNKDKLKEIRKAAFDGSLDRDQVVWLLRTVEEIASLSEITDEAFLRRFLEFLTHDKGYTLAMWQTMSMDGHSLNKLYAAGYEAERLVRAFLFKEMQSPPVDALESGGGDTLVLD